MTAMLLGTRYPKSSPNRGTHLRRTGEVIRYLPKDLVLPKLRVGLDLDGCFYDFAGSYWVGCLALGIIDQETASRALGNITRWEFYEDGGHTLPEFLANCDELADAGLLWGQGYYNRDEWKALEKNTDLFLHVVTDRTFGSHPAVSQVATIMGLAEGGLRYDAITFTAIKETVELDLMLDDKVSNYDALDAAGVEVYLLDRPWNRSEGCHRRRIYSITEYQTRVEARDEQRVLAAVAALEKQAA
jgi:hypothetical protein